MRKLIAAAAMATMLAGGVGIATATPGPGNGNNAWGLCNAYAHNNPNAHKAPPFAALEQAAQDANQSVADWCAANAPHPGNSGK